MIKKYFQAHPASVGETYFEHLASALSFARIFLWAAIAAIIHAFFPFLFVKTGSEIIEQLHSRMVTNRSKLTNDVENINAQSRNC